MRTTHEYTEALKAVRDMSSDDEPRDMVCSLCVSGCVKGTNLHRLFLELVPLITSRVSEILLIKNEN